MNKADLDALLKKLEKEDRQLDDLESVGVVSFVIAEYFAKLRSRFREARLFWAADELRQKIEALGYLVQDNPDGYNLCVDTASMTHGKNKLVGWQLTGAYPKEGTGR